MILTLAISLLTHVMLKPVPMNIKSSMTCLVVYSILLFFFLAALAGPVGEPGTYIPLVMSIAIPSSAIVSTALKQYHHKKPLNYVLFFIGLVVVFIILITEP